MSPKYFHSALQEALLILIRNWCKGKGRVKPEWAMQLQRHGRDWVPTPDLIYFSYDRLPKRWRKNEACPVACELAIEIISPGQTLKDFEDKAQDYFNAGVLRVWVVDPEDGSINVLFGDRENIRYEGDVKIVDSLLPGLELSPKQIFAEADLIDEEGV